MAFFSWRYNLAVAAPSLPCQLNPTIVGTALVGVILCLRLGCAEAAAGQPAGGDGIALHQRGLYRQRAPAREFQVRGIAADVVGVARDAQLPIGVLCENAGDFGEDGSGFQTDP